MNLANLVLGIVIGIILWRGWRKHRVKLRRWWQKKAESAPRQWHPKSEKACPGCQEGLQVAVARVNQAVEPYRSQKRKAGSPKQLSTEGYACPCRDCTYFGITSEAVHALVGYGKIGKDKTIQRRRCQACRTTSSCRRGTLLYYLKSDPAQVEQVLWFLAEGVDVSVLVRYSSRHAATVIRWLERAGGQSAGWHNRLFQGLKLALIQMDELCMQVRGLEEQHWLWLAIDPDSKALPSLHLGARKAEDAYALVHDLKHRLAEPCVPAFTTDGLRCFLYRRALDQIEMSIAYPNLRVRMFGFLPGVTTPGGATHQAINDIGVFRTIPNMTVLEMGDATDVESVLDVTEGVDGPVYIRMIRGEIPRLFAASEPMKLNRARILSRGTDISLFTTGICTEEAMRTTQALRSKGLSVEHLHISTLKPFSDPLITEAAAKARYGVITMENHSTVGGLGTAVAERMVEARLSQPLRRLGLDDRYLHGASRRYLMAEYGIDASALVGAIEALVSQRLDISPEALATAPLEMYFSDEQQEAL